MLLEIKPLIKLNFDSIFIFENSKWKVARKSEDLFFNFNSGSILKNKRQIIKMYMPQQGFQHYALQNRQLDLRPWISFNGTTSDQPIVRRNQQIYQNSRSSISITCVTRYYKTFPYPFCYNVFFYSFINKITSLLANVQLWNWHYNTFMINLYVLVFRMCSN